MWMKMCPKCGGDLYLREDLYFKEIACMQCGHLLTPQQEVDLARKVRERQEKRAAA